MVRGLKAVLFFVLFTLHSSFFALHSHAASEDDYWLSEDPAAGAQSETASAGADGAETLPQKDGPAGKPAAFGSTGDSTSADETKSLVLKLMVVNPSTKHKQTFPLKAYLPEEVKVEHILNKEDLEVGYDSEKKSYYLQKEIELEPGASVVKAVRVQDIWYVTEEKLNALSQEAHDVFEKLQSTEYSEQGRLLLNNIEVLLMQILERQTDKTLTPNEHISVYRDNKKKVFDIEMDLMAMRRFLASSGEGLMSSSKSKSGSMPGFFSKVATASKNGLVPGWVLWRVIFAILIFLGFCTLMFVLVLQHQIRLSFSRKQLMAAVRAIAAKDSEKDKEKRKDAEVKISDFFPGLSENKPLKKDDAA